MRKKTTRNISHLHPRFESGVDAAAEVMLMTRWVRWMDDYFGTGAWQPDDHEPEENKLIRRVALDAFRAGAGRD
jgi:hypothetical protein